MILVALFMLMGLVGLVAASLSYDYFKGLYIQRVANTIRMEVGFPVKPINFKYNR